MTLAEAEAMFAEQNGKLQLLEQISTDAIATNARIGGVLFDEQTARMERNRQAALVEQARRTLGDRRNTKRVLELEIATVQGELTRWGPDNPTRLKAVEAELSNLQREIGARYPLLADALHRAGNEVGSVSRQHDQLVERLTKAQAALNRLLS